MQKLLAGVHRSLIVILGCAVLLLMVPVSLQVFSRFTNLIPSYMWTEELSRFLFIWMVMIGATVGVREGLHFDVDVWANPKPQTSLILKLISNLLIVAFSSVILYWGIKFTQFGWYQTSELADMPMWLIFIAWPVCGFFWLVFLLEACLQDVRRLNKLSQETE
ncbi:MAG: TRAP transporter small permease [Betaproteobacteria bacterium]|jgi:TRAP-type C4-dicarboxylate transport system permease small subunit|nr:TRAP transporter small permease [Betaproteobacteria bacterium]